MWMKGWMSWRSTSCDPRNATKTCTDKTGWSVSIHSAPWLAASVCNEDSLYCTAEVDSAEHLEIYALNPQLVVVKSFGEKFEEKPQISPAPSGKRGWTFRQLPSCEVVVGKAAWLASCGIPELEATNGIWAMSNSSLPMSQGLQGHFGLQVRLM